MGEMGIKEVAQIVAPFMAAAALIWAVWSYRAKLRLDHYTEIDKIYSDLVKLRITQPGIAQPPPDPNADRDATSRYDAYAFLVWNFIETIHDRCKTDGKLLETWQPILNVEGELHAEWLSKNKDKFKTCFPEWVSRQIPGARKYIGNRRQASAEECGGKESLV